MHPSTTRLKAPVYALENPSAPGLYYAVDGDKPRLAPLAEASLAPHTPEGLAWLNAQAARCLTNAPHELVRLEPAA